MSLTQEDRTDISFRDPHYLDHLGGKIPSAGNALEYLSLASEFYTSSCINEQLKMQTRYNSLDRSTLDVSKMSGIEYYTWHCDVPGQVFHLLKQYKYSNTHATPMAAYYILQGNIYQAPDLRALLASRLRTCLHHLTSAYEEYSTHVRFHPAQGYIWDTITDTVETSAHDSKERPLVKRIKPRKKKRQTKVSIKGAVSEKTDPDSLIESPAENAVPLLSAQFINRVDTLIAQSAQKQHVVLVEKPPEIKDPAPSNQSKDKDPSSSMNTKDIAKEASETSSMVGGTSSKRKRQKREVDLQSDIMSLGGESTKSRKKKKIKKEKGVKSPTITV